MLDSIYHDIKITLKSSKVNEGLIIYNFYSQPLSRVNSADPDEHSVVSHQGLCCLYMFPF